MKKILTLGLSIIFAIGMITSAQAAPFTMPDGITANTAFGSISGITFVNSPADISAILNANAQTKYNLTALSSDADWTNTLHVKGTAEYSNASHFNADSSYKYTKVLEDILLSQLQVVSSGQGAPGTYLSVNNASLYDTNTYLNPATKNNGQKFQMFIVTDNQVTLGNNTFYKDSIIFAFDDGYNRHVDFNDLVFIMGAKKPPVVPIPAAAFLLMPGLAGLAVLRKKMK